MKKILLVIGFFTILPANAGLYDDILSPDVDYGYNAVGDYVPMSVGGMDIDYGYNAVGDYAPTAVGRQQIQYGYNAVGDYVPMSVGGRQINYGYNAEGDYVPMSIGDWYFMFENNDLFKKLMQGDEQYQKSKKEIAEFNKKNPELAQAFYDSDESTSYTCSDDK